jgi:hypothetical protein
MRHIVVTWPKSRKFASYMVELERAKSLGVLVNFRVPRLPSWPVGAFDYGAPEVRCYRVHDGRIRGWLKVVGAEERRPGEVMRVESDPLYGVPGFKFWPPGKFIVCHPEWHTLRPTVPMTGFRGWRWFDPEAARATL